MDGYGSYYVDKILNRRLFPQLLSERDQSLAAIKEELSRAEAREGVLLADLTAEHTQVRHCRELYQGWKISMTSFDGLLASKIRSPMII